MPTAPNAQQLVAMRCEPLPRQGIGADQEEGTGKPLADGPRYRLAGGQTGRADRQQAFNVGSTQVGTRGSSKRSNRLPLGQDLEQRRQRARVAAVMDDGELGDDQCRDDHEP
jgi:hypothetical protein